MLLIFNGNQLNVQNMNSILIKNSSRPRRFHTEFFLSEVFLSKITDLQGEVLGKLYDLLVVQGKEYPQVDALIVKCDGKLKKIPKERLIVFNKTVIIADADVDENMSYIPTNDDILLHRDLLDRQIVDINGVKVVRVNDLKLAEISEGIHLIAVDVGLRGVLRRLGIKRKSKESRLWKAISRRLAYNLIDWKYIQMIEPRLTRLTLKVERKQLVDLHPADIADIISQVNPQKQEELLQNLDIETAAETLGELDPENQVTLLEKMDVEQAADLLEKMPSDEAADLLGELPEEDAKELLDKMEEDEAEEVESLLAHEEDTAGGLMTTEFLTVSETLTASEAILRLKEKADEPEIIYYLYVIDDNERLIGVFSLRDLLLAEGAAKVKDFMTTDVKSVPVDAKKDVVAEKFFRYNLLAVPVIDKNNKILGIITFDDVIDFLYPDSQWRRRKKR